VIRKQPTRIIWLPITELLVGGLFVFAAPFLFVSAATDWKGMISAGGLGLLVVVLASLRVAILEPARGELIRRSIRGRLVLATVGAALDVRLRSRYGAVLLSGQGSTVLVETGRTSPGRLIRLAERMGRGLEIPVRLDPAILRAKELQERSFRIALVVFPILIVLTIGVGTVLQHFLTRRGG